MKAVDLNFAATPFRNNTPYYLGYGLGAVALAVFTAYNAWAFVNYSRSNVTLDATYAANRAKLDSLRRESADLQAKIDKVDLGTLNGRAAFTNALLERRRFSWTDLLNSLEEAQVYQVRLLSLLPRIQEKGIIIDARAVAHDLKSMWNFQQNLQNHPKFRRVYPGGWTKSTEEGEIVFNIAFNYFPQGAPEGVLGLTPQEAGLQDFVEAPGPSGDGGADALNDADEAPAEEAPPPAKRAPATASRPAAPAGASMVDAGRGAPPPANPPARLTNDPRTARVPPADLPPGMTADPNGPARPAGGLRPGFVGGASAAAPGGPTGATGATGVRPPRRGRGLPPGSGGVRPNAPPKPDVPMVPVSGPTGGDGGDNR